MRKIVITALFTLVCALGAFAQDPQPTDLIGIRLGYDAAAAAAPASGEPATSGGFIYAHKIAGTDHPTFSYTQINFQPRKTNPYIVMGSTETGIAQYLAKVGPFTVYGLGTAGSAFSGGNVGLSISGGGLAIASLGHNVYAGPYARASKATISTGQYEVGVSFFVAFK